MLSGLKRRANEALHDRHVAAILRTPPLRPSADGPVLFSMIGTRVVRPYLVAVKSLHANLGRGRVALLDDGSLTAADRDLLADQLGRPEIRSIDDVDTGRCPRGGTWERLLTLLDLARDDYVIQLDSDTVTLGPVPEVARAVADARPFLLRGGPGATPPLPLPEFVARTYPGGREDGHLQAAIESRFGDYPDAGSHLYLRACSGFAGFPARTSPGRADAERFSLAAEALVGPARWREWGSEQVASNFLLSNLAGADPLPADRYLNYWNEPWRPDAAFVHFVGTHRYSGNAYADASRAAIARLAG